MRESGRDRIAAELPEGPRGAMNQQHAEIDVPLLADPAQTPSSAAGTLRGVRPR